MRNIDVIEAFAKGRTEGKVGNIQIDGDKFFNYGTCIAQRHEGKVIFNKTKYSKTTSVIQNKLRKELEYQSVKIIEVDELSRGAYRLTDALQTV